MPTVKEDHKAAMTSHVASLVRQQLKVEKNRIFQLSTSLEEATARKKELAKQLIELDARDLREWLGERGLKLHGEKSHFDKVVVQSTDGEAEEVV